MSGPLIFPDATYSINFREEEAGNLGGTRPKRCGNTLLPHFFCLSGFFKHLTFLPTRALCYEKKFRTIAQMLNAYLHLPLLKWLFDEILRFQYGFLILEKIIRFHSIKSCYEISLFFSNMRNPYWNLIIS